MDFKEKIKKKRVNYHSFSILFSDCDELNAMIQQLEENKMSGQLNDDVTEDDLYSTLYKKKKCDYYED